MPKYNKLVRDKIPEIIEAKGKEVSTTILSNEEYIKELKAKCMEEVDEYMRATTNEEAKEELADVLEVLHAITKTHGSSMEEIESIRLQKKQARGGFQERIFLMDVKENTKRIE
ncbi:phosphoribosyl-ATP pyrophosphohydrolase [Rossellomorea marisflavi]|uniref:phosphoribosyl-ATP pyrophosphohydrolase n=1 Tax=Rossellomorea marisflavi TaxID=189381 RepID=UPI0035148F2E